ncbi:protein phosphatase 2C domain-containing protein [Pseudomonas sp. JS3066]|jgi:protein phosphatase|uniref:PP2C family protein-serine/threonine phosphatase n=1 Tax=unclassified Pseudomonas TaxID=196821 RepID=UPI000EA91F5F|nr:MULTISPECIES: protein phosphatase 2C domain-containing protein [unclassified Pseudomonas]AYF87701.1 serine/threonine-protein phosphatase [Pseudomonas sp. DY-1]MDH4655479.1 serine/threonine-protein phosphatase [Pseudomonas sp. BN606]MRK20018.1 serine/threonine-protein phosphatase [Pseudomonas sp. JG-B]WVK94737.1 protein phosphatase 2C domain-containing protein [Pseudomonas sp. JS3066]
MSERLGYAAQSITGCVREHNEDALLCAPELGLWAVADGMGGHQRGEVASAVAVSTLRDATSAGQDLEAAVQLAHAAVVAAAGGSGMGTTLVAVKFDGTAFDLVWAGDSRAYRVSAAGIVRLSHDHSLVQALVDAGELTVQQARQHPRRNVVTQCLGQVHQDLEVGRVLGTLAPGELLLLCSDGLSGELDDEQIQARCAHAETLDELVAQLLEQACDAGGRDNISCIVIGLMPPETSLPASRSNSFLSRLLKSRRP